MDIQMNSKLVQKFIDQANSGSQTKIEELEKIGQAGLPKFEENCHTWLGSMSQEIDEYQAPFYEVTPFGVGFQQVFTWNGCEGIITTANWGTRLNHSSYGPATWLKMHVPTSRRDPEIMKLPVTLLAGSSEEYSDKALPVEENILGKFLLEVMRDIDRVREEQSHRAEKERFEMLKIIEAGFLQLEDIAAIQQYLAQICQSNPDDLARWNAAAKRRTLEITALQEKKRQAEETASLEASEERRLAEAAGKLFRPFTVFQLKIAYKLPDEEQIRNTHVFTTTSVPDETGWFTQVDRGELRKYRPESLVDVTRIEIDSVDHKIAPLVCQHIELPSEKIPYMIEHALATPAGLG